jgi:hypothetical protein
LSKRQRLLIFVAGAALTFGVACGGGDGGQTSTPETRATEPAAATQPPAATQPSGATGGQADLLRVADSFSGVRSFRALITVESDGEKEEGRIEVVLPDRFRLEMGGVQMISIGNDFWINVGGTWMKQAGAGFGASIGFTPAEMRAGIAALATLPNVTRGGTDTVGGRRCQIYRVTEDDETTEICVDDSNLPLRVVSTSDGEKSTVIFTDFNANISIQPPN